MAYQSPKIAGITAEQMSVAETFNVEAPQAAMTWGLPQGHQWAHLVPEMKEYSFPIDALSRFLTWLWSMLSEDSFANIWGPTGSGKTQFVQQVFARLNWPIISVDISEETDVRDLLGGMQLRDGDTTPVPGPFAIAAMNGFAVVAEEFDRMDPRKTVGLNGVLRGGPVRLVEDSDTVYRRSAGFKVIATSNTNMGRDVFGNYVGGKHDLSTIDGRFPLYLGYLAPEVEVPMLLGAAPEDIRDDAAFKQLVGKVVDLANGIRSRFEDGDCDFTMSTRMLLRWTAAALMFEGSARRAKMAPALYSLNATFADGLDAENRTTLFEAYQLAFGEDPAQFDSALVTLGRNQYRSGGGQHPGAGGMEGR